MQIRLFLLLLILFVVIWAGLRYWPVLRRHPVWGPTLTRMAPRIVLLLALRRAWPILLRVIQSLVKMR